ALAHLGPLSAEDAARIDEVIEAHRTAPARDGELELETVAWVLQYAPPRDRDLELINALGDVWKARQATMLGCKPGALRMRKWRRKRDAARISSPPAKSQT